MDRRNRSRLGTGIILVLRGLWFLAVRISPTLGNWAEGRLGWPVIVIAVGLAMLLMGVVTGGYGLAVPAAPVGGVGGVGVLAERHRQLGELGLCLGPDPGIRRGWGWGDGPVGGEARRGAAQRRLADPDQPGDVLRLRLLPGRRVAAGTLLAGALDWPRGAAFRGGF